MTRPPHALGLGRDAYYRFLREVYHMPALDAWNYIKRMGLPPTVADVRAAIQRRKHDTARDLPHHH